MNKFRSKYTSHVLLYHSTFREVPKELGSNVHNVHPEVIFEQLLWLKNNYDFVSVDELIENYRPGKVAVTFDDGYESLFLNSSRIFEELNIPYTVFINTLSLSSKIFWRDKIRYLISNNEVEYFIDFLGHFSTEYKITKDNFFWDTKNPSVSSIKIDEELTKYFSSVRNKGLINYLIKSKEILYNRPCLTIGNHSHNHYILSSLSDAQQWEEISVTDEFLRNLEISIPTSKAFSLPNGLNTDFNQKTIEYLKKLKYKGILLSQSRANHFRLTTDRDGFSYVHRMMVPESLKGLQNAIAQTEIRYFKSQVRKFLKPL